jgi:hypothetical protein
MECLHAFSDTHGFVFFELSAQREDLIRVDITHLYYLTFYII